MSYFFFDIDGTIRTRDDYTIPSSCLEAIKALKQKGHTLFIATGRGFFSAIAMAKRVGIDHVISDGGRVVYYDGKVIYHNPMEDEVIDEITKICNENNIEIGYSNMQAIHSTSPFFSESFHLDQSILCSVKKDLELEYLRPFDKIYLHMDKESYEANPYLHQIEHHQLREKLAVIEREHKDEGIKVLMDLLHITRDDCICFGDDVNDITMFELCKTSICMGNGTPKAKEYATYIAPDIHENGIFEACKALKFI